MAGLPSHLDEVEGEPERPANARPARWTSSVLDGTVGPTTVSESAVLSPNRSVSNLHRTLCRSVHGCSWSESSPAFVARRCAMHVPPVVLHRHGCLWARRWTLLPMLSSLGQARNTGIPICCWHMQFTHLDGMALLFV